MLQNLCYVSSSRANLTSKDLNQLFTKTKQNNLKANISGVLIFNNGNFLQIMEGEKEALNSLYSKIAKDKMHTNLITLIDKPITERLFKDYKTGFEIIADREKANQLDEYLSWLKKAEIKSIDKVVRIIETFVERH